MEKSHENMAHNQVTMINDEQLTDCFFYAMSCAKKEWNIFSVLDNFNQQPRASYFTNVTEYAHTGYQS